MSYILDALKKADAQRERDPARGIHAQPAGVPGASGSAGDRSWFWGASAIAVVGIAAAGWSMHQERAAVVMPLQARDVPPATAPMNSSAPVPPTPAPNTTAAMTPPVATAVLPPPAAPPRIEPVREARHTPQPTLRSQSQPGPGAGAASTAAPATPAAAPVAAVPVTSGPLPPDAPKLAFSGAVYSGNPAQRMLIVNGQVVNEGADLGSGAVLEEIKPKAAVVRFRGARYNVGF